MIELLVLKNAAECTSQRLKRTSGARVMIRPRIQRGLDVEKRGLDAYRGLHTDRTWMGHGWDAGGTRIGRGWDADGTRMGRGWGEDGTRIVCGLWIAYGLYTDDTRRKRGLDADCKK